MALYASIHTEIEQVEPRIFMGLSFRQLVASILLLVVYVVPVGAMMWLRIMSVVSVPQVVIILVPLLWAAPVLVWGWYRPMGIMPEAWLGHVLRFYQLPVHVLNRGVAQPPFADTVWQARLQEYMRGIVRASGSKSKED